MYVLPEDIDDESVQAYKYFRILYPHTSPEAVIKRIVSKYKNKQESAEEFANLDSQQLPSE